MRDICKWHVEEFAYLIAKLISVPEGDGALFDHCCLVYVHEHAEANPHKNSGLAMLVAGGIGRLAKGAHTRVTGTVGDAYLTIADEVMQAGIGKFPSHQLPLNRAWFTAALTAATLLTWLRLLALDGDLARAEPKTLRYRILHAAHPRATGRQVRDFDGLRLCQAWAA